MTKVTYAKPYLDRPKENNMPILKRTKDTADYFQISIMTLYRWRKKEGFPQPLKQGGIYLYDIRKITQWIKVG